MGYCAQMSRGRLVAVVASGLAVLVALALAPAERARATTYYVTTSGSDSNLGLNPATAFATLTRAAKVRGTGHTIVVGPGSYAEGMIKPDGGGDAVDKVPFVFFADLSGEFTGEDPGEVIIDASGKENGFWLPDRSWIVINGFTVTNAGKEGIFVKNASDNAVIANCVVHSNGGRGIRIRDSADVVIFNNLVYANGGTGIEFEGEGDPKRPLEGSPRGVVINNTVYGNGSDGVRIGDGLPSEGMVVINNIVAENQGIGINLKEGSKERFVGQWNLVFGNAGGGYNTLREARGNLDLREAPLFVQPVGSDGPLGGSGYEADGFRLAEGSPAVDASPINAKKLGLSGASALVDGGRDVRAVDLGFHSGNKDTLVLKLLKKKNRPAWRTLNSFARKVRNFRKLDARCEKKAEDAATKLENERGPCMRPRSMDKLKRSCGAAVVYEVCN